MTSVVAPLRDLPIRLGDVTKDNWQQLRRLNMSILPVQYGDKFYRETLKEEVRAITKLAYHHDIVIAAVSARFEPNGTGTRRMYIMTLGVLAPYRRYGVGSKLLALIVDVANKQQDVTHITLHVQTSNDDAIAFYKKFGFQIDTRIDGYYKKLTSPDADCYLLSKLIHKQQPTTPTTSPQADVAASDFAVQ